MLLMDLLLFGIYGITVWAVQMLWIPVFAAGVITGVGHYWGYRNFETPDASTNILPRGALIGSEELHNNHHAVPPLCWRAPAASWMQPVGRAFRPSAGRACAWRPCLRTCACQAPGRCSPGRPAGGRVTRAGV